MQAVVDTNVWVSAFLTPGRTPWQVLNQVRIGRLIVIYCPEIEFEYQEVLTRPRFKISRVLLSEFFERLKETGQNIRPRKIATAHLPDPSDAPFIATALTANCPIVTGNARHYPDDCGVEILSPAQCLARLID